MQTALLPGSFDPPTLGHLNIIERAARLYDKLYVAVGINISKNNHALFTTEERVQMLKELTRSFSKVEVVPFSGLVVEFAKKKKADVLIKGLRAVADLEYERMMAVANHKISGIETVFLLSDEQYSHISSTIICELAHYRAPLEGFVPPSVASHITQKLSLSKK